MYEINIYLHIYLHKQCTLQNICLQSVQIIEQLCVQVKIACNFGIVWRIKKWERKFLYVNMSLIHYSHPF